MVNLQSGPRILSYMPSICARSNPSKVIVFDRLTTNSFGYGGDPNSVTTLSIVKGENLLIFGGSFRRDRQYFDYDLLTIQPSDSARRLSRTFPCWIRHTSTTRCDG